MGNSPSSPPEYRDAVDIFTSSEQKQIVAIYSGIKGPEKQLFDEHDFKVSNNCNFCMHIKNIIKMSTIIKVILFMILNYDL